MLKGKDKLKTPLSDNVLRLGFSIENQDEDAFDNLLKDTRGLPHISNKDEIWEPKYQMQVQAIESIVEKIASLEDLELKERMSNKLCKWAEDEGTMTETETLGLLASASVFV